MTVVLYNCSIWAKVTPNLWLFSLGLLFSWTLRLISYCSGQKCINLCSLLFLLAAPDPCCSLLVLALLIRCSSRARCSFCSLLVLLVLSAHCSVLVLLIRCSPRAPCSSCSLLVLVAPLAPHPRAPLVAPCARRSCSRFLPVVPCLCLILVLVVRHSVLLYSLLIARCSCSLLLQSL